VKLRKVSHSLSSRKIVSYVLNYRKQIRSVSDTRPRGGRQGGLVLSSSSMSSTQAAGGQESATLQTSTAISTVLMRQTVTNMPSLCTVLFLLPKSMGLLYIYMLIILSNIKGLCWGAETVPWIQCTELTAEGNWKSWLFEQSNMSAWFRIHFSHYDNREEKTK
jgi:hypothetical protein